MHRRLPGTRHFLHREHVHNIFFGKFWWPSGFEFNRNLRKFGFCDNSVNFLIHGAKCSVTQLAEQSSGFTVYAPFGDKNLIGVIEIEGFETHERIFGRQKMHQFLGSGASAGNKTVARTMMMCTYALGMQFTESPEVMKNLPRKGLSKLGDIP
jgi:hypothetical protein